jgi:hypothetical protein
MLRDWAFGLPHCPLAARKSKAFAWISHLTWCARQWNSAPARRTPASVDRRSTSRFKKGGKVCVHGGPRLRADGIGSGPGNRACPGCTAITRKRPTWQHGHRRTSILATRTNNQHEQSWTDHDLLRHGFRSIIGLRVPTHRTEFGCAGRKRLEQASMRHLASPGCRSPFHAPRRACGAESGDPSRFRQTKMCRSLRRGGAPSMPGACKARRRGMVGGKEKRRLAAPFSRCVAR